MKSTRSLVRIFVVVTVLVATGATMHLVARAADTAPIVPGLHVDNKPINREMGSGNSYAPVVKKVAPSVVNIYSTQFIKQRLYSNPLMADPFFRQFFGNSGGSREITRRQTALGSGIVVTQDGYILTANHVVEGADEIKVGVENDTTKYDAKVVGTDPATDVAVLKIEAKNLPAVTLGDSDQLQVGDLVLAVGNPFGVGQTVTRGIISALGRSISDPDTADPNGRRYEDFIQTDASINQGNSGGALVDAEGRLIGINDAIVSPSGSSAGIGFAVPINMARNVMEGFLTGGRVARGYLGVDMQDLDSGLAKDFGAPSTQGALITDLGPDTPAGKAGLQVGDVVVAVNDREILNADNLRVVVAQLRPGSQARLTIYRKGVAKVVSVALGERTGVVQTAPKPSDNPSPAEPARADALGGVHVQNLTSYLRRQLGVPQNFSGALVSDVDSDSNSYDAGLRSGDVIEEINHHPVAGAQDAVDLCKGLTTPQIVLKIWRLTQNGGITRYLSVDNTGRAK